MKFRFTFFVYLQLVLFSGISVCSAQNTSKIWYFGQGIGLNFNQTPPLKLTNAAVNSVEGCATICDANGNLLFYTNGLAVINKNHEMMVNGGSLNGDLSSTNNTVIVKLPGSDSIYYLFTVGAEGQFNKGFCYSVINMSLQNGLGEVIQKNYSLNDNSFEKLAAVRHCNKKDVWITVKNWGNDEYYSYLLTSAGLSAAPVVSAMGTNIGGYSLNALGTIKFSSDGKKLIALHSFENNMAQLMDFDNSTGQLSNPVIFYPSAVPGSQGVVGVYGAAFSPDNKLLYISARLGTTNSNELLQFDISSGVASIIQATKMVLWTDNVNAAGALQTGPDGKIYYSRYDQSKLGAILQPNVAGIGCNFQNSYLDFTPRNSAVSYGLPNFIASDLDSNFSPFDFEKSTGGCNDFTVQFRINRQTGMDSVKWDFGDGGTSTALNPSHTYAGSGTYVVTLTVYKVDCGAPTEVITHNVSLGSTSASGFLPRDTSFCVMPSGFSIGSSVSSNTYTWSTGEQTPTIQITAPGTYWLEIENSGCFFRDTTVVSLKPSISIDLGPDRPVCFSAPIQVNAVANGAVSYLWSDGSTQNSLNINFPGTYHVTVKNAAGCADSDTLTTTWGDCPSYIPSAFSPNDDGINETFGVINGMNSAIFTFIIYNRYGQVVFKTNDSRARWDGKFKGKKVPMGAYPWIITYKNRDGFIQTDKGQVMLIR